MRSSSRPDPDPARRTGRRLIAVAVTLGLLAGASDAGRDAFGRWLDATPLPPLAVPTGTEVLARDGSLLRAFQVGDGLWRLAPPAEGIDPRFLQMLVAWEDRRFADHKGVDPRAVIRAAAQGLRHGRIVSGASTLSMQTARLLERGPTADWHAKLRQARLAMALERRIGKDGIMALYLRLAPYGGNTEGVRAAALMWFGKEPTRLTPAEAALLVALPQAPESRRPDIPARREAAASPATASSTARRRLVSLTPKPPIWPAPPRCPPRAAPSRPMPPCWPNGCGAPIPVPPGSKPPSIRSCNAPPKPWWPAPPQASPSGCQPPPSSPITPPARSWPRSVPPILATPRALALST